MTSTTAPIYRTVTFNLTTGVEALLSPTVDFLDALAEMWAYVSVAHERGLSVTWDDSGGALVSYASGDVHYHVRTD